MSAYRPTGAVQYSGADSARKFSPHVGNGVILPPRFRSSRGQLPSEIQNIGNYRLIRTIGKGNFAKVKLAKHMPTGRQVAIKIIDKTQLSTSGMQKLFREVRIMKALDHPNIVKLFEVMESEKYMYLVMEYASGASFHEVTGMKLAELRDVTAERKHWRRMVKTVARTRRVHSTRSQGEIFDYLATNGRMKERDARSKFRQIISAIHYCHQKNIIHRDLKAENLLLDQDMNIKIADFGFSNEFSFGSKLDTFCGSPPYAAPELFQGKKYTGPEVDVWSLGVILYTLSSGSLPFDGSNLKELRERVIKGKYRIPFYLSTDCESLLKKFLVVNATKRTTLETAMKDRWLNAGFDGEELQPYIEPERKLNETRIAEMIGMGFTREQIEESISMHRFDDTYATYQLLGLRPSSLETTSPISWSTISLGRTQSVNHHGTYSTAGGRVPSHPNTVFNSSSRSRPPGPPLALPEVPHTRDLISANMGSESNYRQRSIDNVLDHPATAARLPYNMETPPRDGNVSALGFRPPTGNHTARRDMQVVSRVSSQRVPSRAERELDRSLSQRVVPRSERVPPLERQDNGTPVGAAAASSDVTPSYKQSSKYHPSAATPGSSTEGLDERKTPAKPQTSEYLTGMPEVTGVIPASTAWNSPGIKAFVSPYYSSATKPTNTNFTRNVQTRSTVHGGSVRDRVTPLHSKTSAAAYPEESQDTSALGGRSSRMSFFNKLTSKFSKR